MIENRLNLPKLEYRFIEMHKGKCINGVPISFFNKDKLDLIKNVDEDLIKYTYFLYKNIFFNIQHPTERGRLNPASNIHSEIRPFNREFSDIENKVFRKLKETYINVRIKLTSRSEMSYFFNEFLEDVLLKYNVLHVINKDIWNLMKYVYYGYKPSIESDNMELLIPIDNKNVTLSINSKRSYMLSENFFNLSHYWRMIHLFDRSREDKNFFISLVLNTFINRNYSNIYFNSVEDNSQSNISIAEFIMLNYIKAKSDPLKRNPHLQIFFEEHVKKISNETQIFDYNVLKLFLLHNKNEKNINWTVSKILENIYNKYPVFNFKTSQEAEEDEIVLDDEPKKNKKDTDNTETDSDEIILDEEPQEEGEGDDDSEVDNDIVGAIPELGDDENTDNTTDDDSISEETDPIEENNDTETSIYETDDELDIKSFSTKRKIFNLNMELKNKQINSIEAYLLNKWCKEHLWAVTYQQSLKLIKEFKFKLP